LSGGSNVPSFGTSGQVDANQNPLIPSYTILLKALNQQGKTSVVSEPRTLCQNNQVCVIRITRNQGYVASIENTSNSNTTGGAQNNNNSVTSQVTPGVVVTGFTLYVLPKVLNNKVYLSVNADISNLVTLRTLGGQVNPNVASTQIELPDVTEKHFNQRSMIRSGDTLILSGIKQMTNLSGASQFITAQALGGTAAGQINSETVILITPIILDGKC
jgi:type II secretory pathway component GspD/PulD (secretin)